MFGHAIPLAMSVTQEKRSGTLQLGEHCSSLEENTLTQAITGDGLFTMQVWQEIDDNSYLLSGVTQDDRKSFSSVIGNEGIVIAIFIILTITLVMIWSPGAAVVASLVGIIAMTILGLLNLGWASLIAMIILGGFLVYKLKT